MAEKEKQPPDASLLSTDMLIVKSPSVEDPGGGSGGGRARCCLGCLRGADDRTALVSLGGMHVALGIVLVVGGALGAARGAALGAASAGLWGGGAAGAAGCAGLFTGLRGGGAAAFVALSLVALALSNLVAVLGATALVRDAARVGADAEAASSAVNGGLTAASLLHVAVCLWTVWRCHRLACPCLQQSRSSAASWDSAGSGRRRLVNSWLGTQRPPPLIVGPIFTIPAPPPNLPPASIINYHLPAPVPYINPLAQPRYIVPRPHSQVHSYTSRPKRKRAIEEVNRWHTLDGRKSSKMKKQPHQLTDEDVERTYTGLDRNLAEEFIQIAMEPGLAKERESRSNSDNNSNRYH